MAAEPRERPEPERAWELIAEERITHLCGAPTVLISLLAHERAHERPIEWDELPAARRAAIKARRGVATMVSELLRVVDDTMTDVPRDGETLGDRRRPVIGLPDERWGERPYAFVTLRSDAEEDPEALREFVRERIAGFKVPERIEFRDDFPRTATGKIQKFVLREEARRASSRARRAAPS